MWCMLVPQQIPVLDYRHATIRPREMQSTRAKASPAKKGKLTEPEADNSDEEGTVYWTCTSD